MLIGRSRGGPVWLNNFAGGYPFFTSFQPEEHVVGATEVSDVTELEAAIAASASRIELDTPGNYTLTQNLIPLVNTEIAATVAGAVIDGDYCIRNSTVGVTLTIRGVEIALTGTLGGYGNAIIVQSINVIELYRCFIHSTSDKPIRTIAAGSLSAEGCIIRSDSSLATRYCVFLDESGDIILKNCTFLDGGGGGTLKCLGEYGSGTMYAYNCAGEGDDFQAGSSFGGDYNIGVGATVVGAHSLDSVTWGNYYSNNVEGIPIPTSSTSKQGGDTGNAADYDYYGNNLNDLIAALGYVPIGAIAAK